jgi:8-oxo-dGTP pyrophosphatase MutT (NUDIX family)
MKKQEHIAAGGIVIRETERGIRVLLIKDGYGHWSWPKGHQEKGESVDRTALREVREETGLKDLHILAETGLQEYTYSLGDTEVFKKVHIYLMRTSQKELTAQTEEIEECRWFSEGEALNMIEYDGSVDILKKTIELYKHKR